jgi:hypothetical protein
VLHPEPFIDLRALFPTATLQLPLPRESMAFVPMAVLPWPEVLAQRAEVPTAVLLFATWFAFKA